MAILMVTSPRVPVLCPGDRLTRDEFERRYSAMPDLKKAELIEGVVYMMPRIPLVSHGAPVHTAGGWLAFYREVTPVVECGANCTVRLDLDNEPQPDILVRLPEHHGGTSRLDADGFVEGPPELVIEVTSSSSTTTSTRSCTCIAAVGCTASTTARSIGSGSNAEPTCVSKPTPVAS